MSAEPTDDLPKTDPAPAAPRRVSLALVLAALAVALASWNWFSARQGAAALEQTLGKRLAESDATAKESRLLAAQAQEGTRDALVKLGLLEQKLSESQNQQLALEALYQELSRNRDEWALAEIEQILLIASQQLQLAGNVRAALLALQTADSRLQRLDRPQLIGLRKVINKDIERLQALPLVDTAGISLRLDGLVAAVDGLPFAIGSEPQQDRAAPRAQPPRSLWDRLGGELWQDFRQLVRISRLETTDIPLLAPSQSYFLRENLKLRLLAARLALLQRDQAGFKADLKACEDWLTRYFDVKARPTQNVLAALRQLAASPVSIELPDIAASLSAVRNYKLARERTGR